MAIKTYHSKYSVQDEVVSYERLVPIICEMPGLRLPHLYQDCSEISELCLEFVEGDTLQAILQKQGVQGLDTAWVHSIIELCSKSYLRNLLLDADPSNFIHERGSDRLVFVDPMMDVEGVQHVSIAVFLWGLAKYRVRRCYRIGESMAFRRVWALILREYCHRTGCQSPEVYRSLSNYAANVVDWNIHESGSERVAVQVARLLFVVPAWWALEQLFKFKSVVNTTGKLM